MSRVSVDSQPRPVHGEKTVRGYVNSNGTDKKKSAVLIDVESDYYDNVIIIDVPDSVPYTNKFRVPTREKGKGQVFTNVINIDDEDDDEMCYGKQPGNYVKNKSAEASTSRKFSCEGDGDTEKGKRAQENLTPVRLSKCKRTYSGKAFGTNHYGLDTDSEEEGDASDNDDFPDCEVMVDSSGRVQKQWEKAFFKRWKDMNKGDSGAGNNRSTSKGIDSNQRKHFDTEGETMRTEKVPFSSDTNKTQTSNGYKAPSSGMHVDTKADEHPRSDLQDNGSTFIQTKLNKQKDSEPEGSKVKMDSGQKNTTTLNPNHQEKSEAEKVIPTSASFTCTSTSAFKASTTPALKTAVPPKATTAPNLKATAATGTTSTATTTPSCTAFIRKCQKVVETVAGTASSDPKNLQKGTTKSNNKKNSFSKPAEIQKDGKLQSSEKEENKDEHCENDDGSRVLIEREKMKETDEYKKAMDEEWASRQKALKSQAEEAQRQKLLLRKRKKAESQRLSDMKKRQKTRLDEIRSTQKKDEENMNLREVIRAEVRKDLQKLELSCKNMASLLHSLGVSVTGWPNPQPQEVQAAYKKALLTFHPDRASRFDIRKQVEAEEKFKLVNRLKEKFSPTL